MTMMYGLLEEQHTVLQSPPLLVFPPVCFRQFHYNSFLRFRFLSPCLVLACLLVCVPQYFVTHAELSFPTPFVLLFQMYLKEQRDMAFKAEEEAFREAMMAKFAEDDRVEQLNAQKR